MLSPNPEVLRCAERIGAQAIEAGFDGKRRPYPITVDASGDPAGLRPAIESTHLDGVCKSPVYYPAPERRTASWHQPTLSSGGGSRSSTARVTSGNAAKVIVSPRRATRTTA